MALAVGLAFTAVSAVTGTSVALIGLLAAFVLGAAFPETALLAGALVIAPEVGVAVARGLADSPTLTAVALVAGAIATASSALVAAGGALARRSLDRARSA